MTGCNKQSVNAAKFLRWPGAHGVGLHPRIENDYFSGWRSDAKRRMTEPRQFVPSCFEHA